MNAIKDVIIVLLFISSTFYLMTLEKIGLISTWKSLLTIISVTIMS
jgi:hypothetical protein